MSWREHFQVNLDENEIYNEHDYVLRTRESNIRDPDTGEAYAHNLEQLTETTVDSLGVTTYLYKHWLARHKELFVVAWTKEHLHFGNHTTSRVESQHAKLKLYLDSSQSDLQRIVSYIYEVVNSQVTGIRASIQESRIVMRHRYNIPHFQNLNRFISLYALGIIFHKFQKCGDVEINENYRCQLRTSYGLPCSHEQAMYLYAGQPLPLDVVDAFWKKFDFSPCISSGDNLDCEVELEELNAKFNKQFGLPSTTSVRDHIAKKTTRGRPSGRKTYVPPKPSNSSLPKQARHEYINQFPRIFHAFIDRVQDVKADGNCGFREIVVGLRLHEDEWSTIRYRLLHELNMHHQQYVSMFGADVYNNVRDRLNFFNIDECAPMIKWMSMPEIGILIALHFNVILHTITNLVSLATQLNHNLGASTASDSASQASGFVTSNVGNSLSPAGNAPNSISFVTKVKGNTSQKTVNFRPLFTPASNDVDVHVPKESGKFCLVKSMMIKDMHFFKFGFKEGMEAMLESSPWLIHNVPLILKQWTPDANIMKEDVFNIHVWVKFHDVPITAFTEDGLSAIATKLGIPSMLDSYTATMCTDSWGRASYARAMIELKADVDLRDTIVVTVPKFSSEGFTTSIINVEYEWAPPRCSECKVFGHFLDDCPKKIVSDISNNSKMSRQPARGPSVGLKPKSTFVYRPISIKKAAKANGNLKVQTANKATTPILNSFYALSTLVDEEEGGGNQTPSTNATPVVANINELEIQMLDGKLVLVDEHEKPLEMNVMNEASARKPSTSMRDQLVESHEDEVEFSDDETSRYMSSTGGGGFCEDDLDFYDGYEVHVYDLPKQMQSFCDQFDIRL
ncbi:FAR-RED impaired response 1-like protein, partial [Tanacetum coccineum]